jgi:hypothetical protein
MDLLHRHLTTLYCLCIFVCCVLLERGALFCVLCLIVELLPPGKIPFAVQLNNNNNNYYNNNNNN